MADAAFDTLKMAQGLKDAGMENKQAETVVTLMNNIINERIATKLDLETTETALRSDLTALRSDLKATEAVLRSDMEKLELRLTVRTFVMQASFTVALFAALKLFL